MTWLWPALLLLIPLAGVVGVVVAPARQAKWIALGATTITFVHSVILSVAFEHWHDGGFGLEGVIPQLGLESLGIRLSFGVDSVALLLVLLTTLLMPLAVWGSFSAITERVKEYYSWLLAIEAAMIGVFLARDLIFFYICFEFTLVPMYFLIAIWGSENRARASTKFFLYTFTGSLIALAGLLYVAWQYQVAGIRWHRRSPVDEWFLGAARTRPRRQRGQRSPLVPRHCHEASYRTRHPPELMRELLLHLILRGAAARSQDHRQKSVDVLNGRLLPC